MVYIYIYMYTDEYRCVYIYIYLNLQIYTYVYIPINCVGEIFQKTTHPHLPMAPLVERNQSWESAETTAAWMRIADGWVSIGA